MNDEGWQLVYQDSANDAIQGAEKRYKATDFLDSLGFMVGKDGGLSEVLKPR